MLKKYDEMTKEELLGEQRQLQAAFDAYKAKGLKLNMARGKPGSEQLALSMPMLDVLNASSDCKAEDGVDCRNYGELSGIVDAKKLFGELMGASEEEILISGSSSLSFMYDAMARAMLKGVLGSDKPWGAYPKIKFICPVPGYDRHFAICEFLGIEMISVPLYADGPDMDMIEKLVAEDETIKGMWSVPKYTNPMGSVYSDETVRRLAKMNTAAKDFRIFWDNAYALHHVYKDIQLLSLLDECKKAGNPNRVYMFGSTSKITFPGSGVSYFVCSKENMDYNTKQLGMQAIGWDKMNMLRHVRFFKNAAGVKAHMDKHAAILRSRFDAVIEALDSELASRGVGSYVKPEGGYFVAYKAENGCAKKIVALCKDAGVVLTNAGATHPYGKDPEDAYIRIAPSYPSPEELKSAMEIFCVSARLATVEKLIG
ncbi:aminotransferase class I/II-fold pyridoxal phosphate-dependent enzyme [Synergistaceae bacterium OttesenSCG-928-D05]|nr:aminotransferase class I/II-fold pyridoxal phosphate-dependent enzyme [Synergistaceae bacterium OttesenSCG-928-D05]